MSQVGLRSFATFEKKKTRVKKKQRKIKVDVHLLAIRCTSYFLEECFLQHHFNNVFGNTTSTPLVQHCFNITFATLSSATTL
jgi:hypothetical protein